MTNLPIELDLVLAAPPPSPTNVLANIIGTAWKRADDWNRGAITGDQPETWFVWDPPRGLGDNGLLSLRQTYPELARPGRGTSDVRLYFQ